MVTKFLSRRVFYSCHESYHCFIHALCAFPVPSHVRLWRAQTCVCVCACVCVFVPHGFHLTESLLWKRP